MRIGMRTFIEKNDPVSMLKPFINIVQSFNKKKSKYNTFNLLYALYLVKIRYPLFQRKVKNLGNHIAEYLVLHPDSLLFYLDRYISFFIMYCKAFSIKFSDVLDRLFDKDEFVFDMTTEETKEGIIVKSYNIIVRSDLTPFEKSTNILSDFMHTKPEYGVYCITRLEADLEHKSFILSEFAYDATRLDQIATAKQLYTKELVLKADGRLYSPNYALGREILDKDLAYYRIMLAHIMACISEIFEKLLAIYFVKI